MAAGLGFKTFTTGEVLTAADTNGYLMQGVLVFASAAARDAAITSPQEGQFAYLKDTNVTTYYTGSAWANLDTTGMTNPMTTTGDTIYSSSGSTPARLGIGSTGQVLTVASGIPSWATPAATAQNFSLLNSGGTSLSGSSTSITGISGMNSLYIMVENASSGTTSSYIYVTFNNDTTGANYPMFGAYIITVPVGETNLSGGGPAIGRMANNAGSLVSGSVVVNGCNSSGNKVFQGFGSGDATGGGSSAIWQNFNGVYTGSSTISSVQVRTASNTFDNGKVYIYGSA